MADLFVVQHGHGSRGKGNAIAIDRKGRISHRLDQQVIDAFRIDNDVVFLTNHAVIRRSNNDETVWMIPFTDDQWIAGGGIRPLANGDLIVFLYCLISDSGVQVIRLDRTGQEVWRADCLSVGVMHSAYRHVALLSIDEQRVKITSRGSSGIFVELLDLQTGKQLGRVVSNLQKPSLLDRIRAFLGL
jgi:hypothetical protein